MAFLLLFALLVARASTISAHDASPYSIVIDGGSTGSRLHIFRFQQEENNGTQTTCVREGSSRANVPLSDFAPIDDEPLDPKHVAAHLLVLFESAAEVIPPQFYDSTVVKIQNTAGARLLTYQQQTDLYDALYQGLMNSKSFVFRGMRRGDIATLSGDLEGFYGAVAANYLAGIIDANLHVIETDGARQPLVGAIDMGGSSTQIVYLTTEQIDNGSHSCSNTEQVEGTTESSRSPSDKEDEDFPRTCRPSDYNNSRSRMQEEHFFSTSHLSYGVDQFRERLWNTLIMDSKLEDHSDNCDTKMIPWPCGFSGHQLEWEGYTFYGTGDHNLCTKQVQRLLPHPEQPVDNHQEHAGTVGGISHPPLTGKFLAMSLYFFTLDALRVLSHPDPEAHKALDSSWPRPSIAELTNALNGLCSRSWSDDLVRIQDEAHQFTRAEVLPYRCFESVYLVTILRDGFGFHPQSRDITFTFLVDGSEVEWSLGMALALFSDEGSQESDDSRENRNSTVTTEEKTWRESGPATNIPSSSYKKLVSNSGGGSL